MTDERAVNMWNWNLEEWFALNENGRVRLACAMQAKLVHMRQRILDLQAKCCGSDDLCNGCKALLGIANEK